MADMNIAREVRLPSWKAMRKDDPRMADGEWVEDWTNDEYDASVRRRVAPICGVGPRAKHALVMVSRRDGGSVMDWRDLQQIKSDVLGPEWFGVELFPPESRLIDPSNARFLWCWNAPMPFGLPDKGRFVLDSDQAIAPQRPLRAGSENRGVVVD